MSTTALKTNFIAVKTFGAFYTGGRVQATADGKVLLCQCDSKLNALDIDTGVVLHSIGLEDDGDITCFLLSPDNEILVIANRNLVLRHWNFKDRKVERSWPSIHVAPVTSMAFDSSSTLLASGSADSTVKVWDLHRRYCTHNLRGHKGVVSVVQFHPDNDKLQLYSAADDYQVRAWGLETSRCVGVMEGHYSVVTALQVSADGLLLYSGARDSTVLVWDLTDFTRKKIIPVYESVESVLLLSNTIDNSALNIPSASLDQHFIVGGSKGRLRVWNAQTSKSVFPSNSPASGDHAVAMETKGQSDDSALPNAIMSAFYVAKRQEICVISFDRNILLHGQEGLSLAKQFAGHNDDILDIKFFGVADSHIAVATNSSLIKVFEVDTWACQILSGHTDIVVALDVYQRGAASLLVSASKDNSIRVWSMDAQTKLVCCIAVGLGHTHTVGAVAFSRQSLKFLVSASTDLTLKLWRLENWNKSDGSACAPVPPGEAVIQIHADQTERAHDKDINCVGLSPNDAYVATGSQDKTCKLWGWDSAGRSGRGDTLRVLGVLRGHKRGVWAVQFSPHDQVIVTASADTTIRLWDLKTCSCVKTFEGHESSVLRVKFLSRGFQLISSGSDGMLKLWSVKDCVCVRTFDAHEEKVWAMDVDRLEQHVVSGAGDSTIVVWKDATEHDLEEARAKREDFMLKEQKLSNLLKEKKYTKALALTIVMDQPFRALNIIKELLKSEEGEDDLETVLIKLRDDQLDAVLKFAVSWNTNSKNCHPAQSVLRIVLTRFTAERLLNFPNIQSIIEGLLPYTERHFERLSSLVTKSTFVDYVWQTMRVAEDDDAMKMEDSEDMLLDEMKMEEDPVQPNGHHESVSFVAQCMDTVSSPGSKNPKSSRKLKAKNSQEKKSPSDVVME